jgi:zinc D-Ala-D-Ala carboxypeptidase
MAAPVRPGQFFSYAEFIGSGGCSGLSGPSRMAVTALCEAYLDPLRKRFGVTRIVSGCRSPGHNRAVGGAPNSMHMYGAHPGVAAADVVCARGRPADWYAFLEELRPGGLGLYTGHVHVDNRPGRARW